MNRAEIIDVLTKWSDLHKELEEQFDRLEAVLGVMDGPLTQAAHEVAEAHTESVAIRVGDLSGMLDFWRYEARFGASPHHTIIDGDAYYIDSIGALADAIMEVRRAEAAD